MGLLDYQMLGELIIVTSQTLLIETEKIQGVVTIHAAYRTVYEWDQEI